MLPRHTIITLLCVLISQIFASKVEWIRPVQKLHPYPDISIIPNQFIFKFQANTSREIVEKYYTDLEQRLAINNQFDGGEVERILWKYSIGYFRGFAAKLNERTLEQERFHMELFESVESDSTTFYADSISSQSYHPRKTKAKGKEGACAIQHEANWGLCRVSSGELEESLDTFYQYPVSSGQGVTAYIIDSGIDLDHDGFSGRAIWGANFVPDSPNTDCNGHGTHVAGIVGSDKFGVAKKVTLVALKMSPCKGGGPISAGIAAVQWATDHFIQNGKKPSLVNMSLGARSGTFETAVTASIEAGLPYIVAAGNSASDACKISPALIPTAITVASTSIESSNDVLEDIRSAYSNFGSCVSLLAPGELIESTYIGDGDTETTIMSGTSMASPMVAGVAALYLGENGYRTPAQVKDFLLTASHQNFVDLNCDQTHFSEICQQTPNKLLYWSCE